MILATDIQGIPCRVRVLTYIPAKAARTWGPPERCYPDQPEVIEFEVLDRRGYPAPWLERKMLDADTRAIEQEIIAAKEAERQEAALAMAEWGAYA